MPGESSRIRLECSDRVATIYFGETTLTRGLLRDFDQALRSLERSAAADVLILRGGRPGCFLTGPSLNEYAGLTDDDSRRRYAQLGQTVFKRLENLSTVMPTVALLDGECTNAGLELVLACDFRLAVARPETRIGFSAVDDGLLPCWGGTQRLPRLVGFRRAGEMLIRNQVLPARAAKSLGLIDHAFGPRSAKTELNWFVADVQDRGRRADRLLGQRSWWTRVCEHSGWIRPTIRAHDPIGLVVVESMVHGWKFGLDEGYAAERAAFVHNALHPAGVERRQLARQRRDQAVAWRDVPIPARIGVFGGSAAAIDLAVAALYGGASLVLFDPDPAERAAMPERLRQALRQNVDQGRFTILEAEQKLKAVTISSVFDAVDLVLITGLDRAQAAALVDLDRRLPAGPVLATTSPTLRLAPLALKQPDRTASLHLTSKTPSNSVELIATRFTSARTIAALVRWLSQCGFIVTAPELAEAESVETAA